MEELAKVVRCTRSCVVFPIVEPGYPSNVHQVMIYWSGKRLYWYDSNGKYVANYMTPAFLGRLQRLAGVPVSIVPSASVGVQNLFALGSCCIHACWAASVMSHSPDTEDAWSKLHDKNWLTRKDVCEQIGLHARRLACRME
jgi:hypothetical protein